jgi:SAM-dependent methyltransferase
VGGDGTDRAYLRTVQYADDARLSARARLHIRYRTAREPWFPWLVGLITWPAGARVLDAGCGPGWLWATAGLPPADRQLTLSDLSRGMVERARATAAGAGVVADTQRLPFASGRFAVAVANHTLYHLPDPARGVAELARVLEPDGVLVAATNGSDHLREVARLRAEVLGGPDRDPYTDAFGRESGGPLLRARFGEVVWHTYHDELACTDADDVVAFVASTPAAEGAGAAPLADLRARVQARIDAGGGTSRVTKDSGAFVCRHPRPG